MSLESKGMGEELKVGRRMSDKECELDEMESPEFGHCDLLVFRTH